MNEMLEERTEDEVPPVRPPWKPIDILWTLLSAAFLTGIAVLIIGIFGPVGDADFPPGLFAVVGLIGYAALFASAWFFALRRRGATLKDAGFVKVPFRVILFMIPVTLGMMVLQGMVINLTSSFFGPAPSAEQQLGLGEGISLSQLDLILFFLLGAVGAPLLEEFFFRGLLLKWLSPRLGWGIAAGISALLFAAIHFIPVLIPGLFVMGMVTAWATERCKSIVPAIAIHAINNGIVILIVFTALNAA